MLPRLIKTENLAPVRPERKILHEMACQFGELQFRQKGGMASVWVMATGPSIAWIETDWQSSREKDVATFAMREMLEATGSQAYSFITEAWVASFEGLSDAERKHWMDFSNQRGLSALPPHLRDDILMVLSFDRAGGCSMSQYIVQMRKGKGPNYLGPRIDANASDGLQWAGRMGNLFLPQCDNDEIVCEAEAAIAAAARSAES